MAGSYNITPRAHAAIFLAMFLILALTFHAQQPEVTSYFLTVDEHGEMRLYILKIRQMDEDMQSLAIRQQGLIRQMREYENQLIADRGLLPREDWFYSPSTRTIERVPPPISRPPIPTPSQGPPGRPVQ